MCGIAGIVNLTNTRRATVKNLCILSQAIRHRGPDDEGFLIRQSDKTTPHFGNQTPSLVRESSHPYSPSKFIEESSEFDFGLVHRRLSILDISPAGHQPMCNKDKSTWITFNGEIYNYIELRNELTEKGHQFITQTDTEVLLAAYSEWGTECVSRLNGMWAFVVFDSKKNTFFGSRDRTGVKPFYYHLDNTSFSFASELKALSALDFIVKKVNGNAAIDFLLFNKVEYRENSIFNGILELFPAHSFTLDITSNQFSKWKYYTPEVNYTSEKVSKSNYREYVEKTKSLIENSVQLRLRSDVSVGTCLSGGIDSSSIVGIINSINRKENLEQIGSKLKTFTCSFKDITYDESSFAKEVITATNTEWYQVFPKKNELVADLEQMIYTQDVPLLSTSTYAQYKVMQLASENNVKVLLNGQGADELFAGYAQHKYAYEKSKGLLHVISNAKERNGGVKGLIRNYGLYDFLPRCNPTLRWQLMRSYYDELKFLNKDFVYENIGAVKQHQNTTSDSLNKLLKHEYFDGPLKRLLKCEDRNSMHFSLESRTPFADDIHLMNYLFSIPDSYKLSTGLSKSILRDAMQPYLPKKIYNRTDKMGFVTPNNLWISEIKNHVRDSFENIDESIFNKQLIMKEFDSFFSPKSSVENYRIFKFIGFVIWQNQFAIKG
ncbi:MAG: asparagine synthase (glutamine-hydrolyzing) [Flavobacteriales bacterium]|nr:asparagine synthase (glutamine-hydrolyzing) [Flavobacteriales bacterium]